MASCTQTSKHIFCNWLRKVAAGNFYFDNQISGFETKADSQLEAVGLNADAKWGALGVKEASCYTIR